MKAEDYGARGLALFFLGLFALVFLLITWLVGRVILFFFAASGLMSAVVSACVAMMLVGLLIAVVAMYYDVKD